jgi:hypothetical protein
MIIINLISNNRSLDQTVKIIFGGYVKETFYCLKKWKEKFTFNRRDMFYLTVLSTVKNI